MGGCWGGRMCGWEDVCVLRSLSERMFGGEDVWMGGCVGGRMCESEDIYVGGFLGRVCLGERMCAWEDVWVGGCLSGRTFGWEECKDVWVGVKMLENFGLF